MYNSVQHFWVGCQGGTEGEGRTVAVEFEHLGKATSTLATAKKWAAVECYPLQRGTLDVAHRHDANNEQHDNEQPVRRA